MPRPIGWLSSTGVLKVVLMGMEGRKQGRSTVGTLVAVLVEAGVGRSLVCGPQEAC